MRYIPVRTGQILPRLYTLFLPWVHPRAYGADEEKDCYEIIGEGSSPYIRGRFALINPHMSPARFIPVYTGRIITLCAKKSKIWAHPRVYGADSSPTIIVPKSPGSSPCIRGGSSHSHNFEFGS